MTSTDLHYQPARQREIQLSAHFAKEKRDLFLTMEQLLAISLSSQCPTTLWLHWGHVLKYFFSFLLLKDEKSQ